MKRLLMSFLLMLPLGCAKPPSPPLSVQSNSAGEQPTPEAVVEKAIKAFGGPEKLARWNVGKVTLKIDGPVLGPDEGAATWEDTFQLPGHVKRVAESKKGKRTFVVNDGSGWEIRADGSIALIENNSSTDRTSHLLTMFFDVRELKKDDIRLSVVGEEGDTIVVRATYEPASGGEWFFDKTTGLPVKTTQPNPFLPGTMTQTHLADYKDFDGGKVPTRITSRRGDVLLADVTIIDLKFVNKWDDSVFGKP